MLRVQVRLQQLAAYLEEHSYTQHSTSSAPCHLREFLSQAVESNNSFDADIEEPTEEGAMISSVSNHDTWL